MVGAILLDRFAAITRRRALRRGDAVFRRDEPVQQLHVVLAGEIRLLRHAADGRPVVLQVAGPEEVLAEASPFAERYQCDALADTFAQVAAIPIAPLRAALADEPPLSQAYLRHLAEQTMALRTALELRNILRADERIRAALAMRADRSGLAGIRPPLKAWAAELGLSHEVLYRTLKDLERTGEIERSEEGIRLLRRNL